MVGDSNLFFYYHIVAAQLVYIVQYRWAMECALIGHFDWHAVPPSPSSLQPIKL